MPRSLRPLRNVTSKLVCDLPVLGRYVFEARDEATATIHQGLVYRLSLLQRRVAMEQLKWAAEESAKREGQKEEDAPGARKQ